MPTPSAKVIIDANVAIWAVLPVVAPIDVIAQFEEWRRSDIDVLAPSLWLAECTSVIRRLVHQRVIAASEGQTALEDLFALEVTLVPPTEGQVRAAYAWAGRLHQSRAYDGFYLAAAVTEEAMFVTGDRRLLNAAAQAGAAFVQRIGKE